MSRGSFRRPWLGLTTWRHHPVPNAILDYEHCESSYCVCVLQPKMDILFPISFTISTSGWWTRQRGIHFRPFWLVRWPSWITLVTSASTVSSNLVIFSSTVMRHLTENGGNERLRTSPTFISSTPAVLQRTSMGNELNQLNIGPTYCDTRSFTVSNGECLHGNNTFLFSQTLRLQWNCHGCFGINCSRRHLK